MPSKPKPPGYEKWTWEEIRVGHRLSKSEKRARRMARHLGATEDVNGRIRPPEKGQTMYYLFFGGLLVAMVLMVIFAPEGCSVK